MTHTLARASALAAGSLLALAACSDLAAGAVGHADALTWIVDLRARPGLAAPAHALAWTAALLSLALLRRPTRHGHAAAAAASAMLAAIAAFDTARYHWLIGTAWISSSAPAPMSLGVLTLAVLVGAHALRPPRVVSRRAYAAAVPLALAVVLGFTLAQMWTFGRTDYRRHVDAVVVFGARAYADGRPSDALADRVRTAVDLYHHGLTPLLILSGGPGDGSVHETQAMRALALSLGVPDDAILLDPQGLSTADTATNVADLAHARGLRRIAAVSHAYHLPRVKLAFQRQSLGVVTTPAHERYTLRKMPYLVAREVAAIWYYAFTA